MAFQQSLMVPIIIFSFAGLTSFGHKTVSFIGKLFYGMNFCPYNQVHSSTSSDFACPGDRSQSSTRG